MSKKSTQAEMTKRKATVLRLLISGMPRADIVQFASKTWGIGDRATDFLIKYANEEIKKITRPDSESAIKEEILRLDDLYIKCYFDKQYKLCLAIAKEKADRISGKGQDSSGATAININIIDAKQGAADASDQPDS